METTEQVTPDGANSPSSEPSAAPDPSAAPVQEKRRGGKSFTLVADTKGAMVNGALFTLYAVVFLVFSVRAEPNTTWFYGFYFLTFMAVFQGGTIVFRQCLHMFPKSTVRIDIAGKILKVTRKNGSTVEVSREVDYTRRKNTLILQGKTHDNQNYNEVIREGAMADGDLDALVKALKRFR